MEPSERGANQVNSPAGGSVVEFTVRAVILGIVLSAVMGAANVYLGLKAGMTVSASIPAAVISMGILRGLMRRGTILENNMVQTIASAGESLAAGIIFTMPGLILTGVWSHFHYWTVSLVALLGGVLGIMFMIPLRRTLIVEEVELKYPEGVACAQVLEAGEKGGRGVLHLFCALGVGAVIIWFIEGIAFFKGAIKFAFSTGKWAVGCGINVSTALVGVGYIVGFNISLLVFIGGAIAWFVAIPIAFPDKWPLAADGTAMTAFAAAKNVWQTQIKYMGVGAMVVGGLWSIFKMRRGILKGIRDAFGGYTEKESDQGKKPRTETDMPIRSIAIIVIAMIVGIFILYSTVTRSHTITARGGLSVTVLEKGEEGRYTTYSVEPLTPGEKEWKVEGIIYEEIDRAYLVETEKDRVVQIPAERVSEKVDAKPGEEVSLRVGKDNYPGRLLTVQDGALHLLTNDGRRFIFTSSEIVDRQTNYRFGMSLVALVAMIAAGFFFVAVSSYITGLVGSSNNPVSGMIICTVLFTSGLLLLFGFTGNLGIIAALGVAGVVCCAAATAGDVSQDLKTGWLVKATPAKQQYGQIIGVAASAFVMAPVLGMLHSAYTIGSENLAAPQADMFAKLVDKIFHHKPFPWDMALAGVCVAVVLIVIDEILRKRNSKFRTYVMPVAIGIYLPIRLAVPILIGGLISLIVGRFGGRDRDSRAAAIQRGVLFCAGLIAGEAIMGIAIGALKVRLALPIQVWAKEAVVLPNLVSIAAVALIVVLVFVVSLRGGKAKES